MKRMLMAMIARFIATIGHTSIRALNSTRTTAATVFSTSSHNTRVCSNDTMSRADPAWRLALKVLRLLFSAIPVSA